MIKSKSTSIEVFNDDTSSPLDIDEVKKLTFLFLRYMSDNPGIGNELWNKFKSYAYESGIDFEYDGMKLLRNLVYDTKWGKIELMTGKISISHLGKERLNRYELEQIPFISHDVVKQLGLNAVTKLITNIEEIAIIPFREGNDTKANLLFAAKNDASANSSFIIELDLSKQEEFTSVTSHWDFSNLQGYAVIFTIMGKEVYLPILENNSTKLVLYDPKNPPTAISQPVFSEVKKLINFTCDV